MAFVKAEAGWNRGVVAPWEVLATSLSDVPKAGIYPYFQAHALIENGLVLACIGVLFWPGAAQIPSRSCSLAAPAWPMLLSARWLPVKLPPPITSMSATCGAGPGLHLAGPFRRLATLDRLFVLLSVAAWRSSPPCSSPHVGR